ncbi:hypothetical protein EGM70_03650 [Enterobacteriaceae bacterium 89]|nr:hypothetical protein [Enterobacteriaceae bacterium 89]
MNTIYRIIWNPTLRTSVVAGELSSAKGKQTNSLRSIKRVSGIVGAVAAALISFPADAWVAETGDKDDLLDGGVITNTSINGGKATGSAHSIAIGPKAQATEKNTLALGEGARASQVEAIAMGKNAISGYTYSNGTETFVSMRSLAIGSSSAARGIDSIALGTGAMSGGAMTGGLTERTIAIGSQSNASSTDSIAIGSRAYSSSAVGSIAIGTGARATGNSSTVFGNEASATSVSGIAVGNGAKSNGALATAVGQGAEALAFHGAAFGYGAKTWGGNYGLALGNQASVGDAEKATNDGIAIGNKATTLGSSGVAIGTNTLTNGTKAVGVGYFSEATGNSGVAMGDTAKSLADRAIAVGAKASASGEDSLALGSEAAASAQFSSSIGYKANASGLNSGAYGHNSEAKGHSAYAFGSGAKATGKTSLALGTQSVAVNEDDVALGAGSVTAATKGTASTTIAGKIYNFAGATPTSQVSVGAAGKERLVTHVAAGELSDLSTDAVNGSQLHATNQAIDTLNSAAVKYDVSPEGIVNYNSVSLGGSTFNSETKTGGTRITNLARGENDSDAVNVQQLREVTSEFYYGGVKYFHANSVKDDSRAVGTDAIAVGPEAYAGGTSSIAMGDGAKAAENSAIALGANAVANHAGDVALGANSTTSAAQGTAGVTIRGEQYAFAGSTPTSTVSVGSEGNERTITNVAAGRLSDTSTDAINGSQLYATNQAVEKIEAGMGELNEGAVKYDKHADGRINYNKVVLAGDLHDSTTGTGGVVMTNVANGVAPSDAVNKSQLDGVSQNVTNIADGKEGMFQVNNTSQHEKPAPTGKDSVAGGAGAVASGDNSLALGTKAKSSHSNAVALGNNSTTDRDNSVSMGSAGSERQVTHVAAGTQNTDAVNVGQLKDSASAATQYTNNKFNDLKNMVDDQKNKLSAGIAGAMAMAGLPQPYQAGASMVGLAGGTYQGESAIALGVSTISDNGKWVTKLSGTTNSRGDTGAAVGVGYQW